MNHLNNLNKAEEQLKATQLAILIYQQRLQHKLTLKETAQDICTPSYLSRIEKGHVNPSKEITSALCTRLNIKLSPSIPRSTPWLDDILKEINEHDLSQLQYRLSQLNGYTLYHQWFQSFMIHVILNHLDDAKKDLLLLKTNTAIFSTQEMAVYLFFSGLYHYKQNHLNKAFEFFEHVLSEPNSPQFITALNLYYLGKIYAHKEQDVAAISSFQQSLALLKQQNNHNHLISCEIMLANLFLKHYQFDLSKTLLLSVQQKLDQIDLFNQTPQLIYTWGNYYFQQKLYPYAKSFYQKSIQLNSAYMPPRFMLAKLYLKTNDPNKQKQYSTHLQNLTVPMSKRHQLKLKFYLFLLQDNRGEVFRIFLEKEAIPYARNSGFNEDYVLYGMYLATYFEQIRKFKKAHTTFKSIHPYLSCTLNE